MADKIPTEKAPKGLRPKCPYCGERLDKVWIKSQGLGVFGSDEKQFLICPHCETLLGFGTHHT